MRRMACIICMVVVVPLLSCKKAELRFVSHATDRSLDLKKAATVKWSIAASKDKFIKVTAMRGIDFNTTDVSRAELAKHLLFKWVKTGEAAHVTIPPGVYDWLIVMNYSGCDYVDEYFSHSPSQIKFHRFHFESGKRYNVVVRDGTNIELTIE